MIAGRVLCAFLVLVSLLQVVVSQPRDYEPHLPPIPNPPYPHKVRFCGIADNETLTLNETTLAKCDWKRYTKVRIDQFKDQGVGAAPKRLNSRPP